MLVYSNKSYFQDIYIDVKNQQEKNELLSIACYEIFSSFDNPFTGFLDLYSRLHDVTVAKANTLAGMRICFFNSRLGLYVQQFVHWLKKHPASDDIYQTSLNRDIQVYSSISTLDVLGNGDEDIYSTSFLASSKSCRNLQV